MKRNRPIVAITREEGTGGPLWRALYRRGAAPLCIPAVATDGPADGSVLDAALDDLASYDWLALSSSRTVEALCARGLSARLHAIYKKPRVAAVGSATARALADHEIVADVVAEDAGAVGLLHALRSELRDSPGGLRILWPRSDRAASGLKTGLEAMGMDVWDPVAYRIRPISGESIGMFRELLAEDRLAAVTFLSPSAADALASSLEGKDLRCLVGKTVVASIGPTTSAALVALGAGPDVEPRIRTVDGLAEAVVGCLEARGMAFA